MFALKQNNYLNALWVIVPMWSQIPKRNHQEALLRGYLLFTQTDR